MPKLPKFVQITAASGHAGAEDAAVFALDETGSVWVYGMDTENGKAVTGWAPLSDHRFTPAAN